MTKQYSSPTHKLLNVFRDGRDKWKTKTIQAKKEIKLNKNRILFLESSKEKLKEKAKMLDALVIKLRAEISAINLRPNNDIRESRGKKKRN